MFSQCSRLRHCDGSIVPQIIWHHCTTTSKVTSNRSSPPALMPQMATSRPRASTTRTFSTLTQGSESRTLRLGFIECGVSPARAVSLYAGFLTGENAASVATIIETRCIDHNIKLNGQQVVLPAPMNARTFDNRTSALREPPSNAVRRTGNRGANI